ncbi:MAG: AraC family transcriptional regulator [Bacteroidetes bacterium]|nr:MAG: AraC family transcriptional regulator [Bacteroidota bacterium]
MHFQIIKPRPALAPYIQHYWVLETTLMDGIVKERVVPTGDIELMFHYRKPFYVLDASGASTFQPRSIITGLTSSWSDVITGGESGAFVVTFYPGAAANFFNFPLLELEDKSVHLNDILHNEAICIEEQIAEATSLQARINIIENFLMKRVSPIAPHDSNLINQGVMCISKHKGQISALALSEQLCVTPKTLERKFARLVGKTPKQFIKIIRFQEVMKSLSGVQPGLLTQHALSNGYFDQAHFIKDFKTYSGYTPKELISQKQCPDLIPEPGKF